MKYLLKAAIHELTGFLLVAIIGAIVLGGFWLFDKVFGENAVGVALLLGFFGITAASIISRAMRLKKEARNANR